MASRVPLQVRIGIRDHWDNPDGPLERARSALRELIGVDIEVKATFVPSLATCAQAFLSALSTLADDESNAQWMDALLERVGQCLKADISYRAAPKQEGLGLSWSSSRGAFAIHVPEYPMPSLIAMGSFFEGQLLRCFEDKQAPAESPDREASSDDWADVSVDRATGQPAVSNTRQPLTLQTRPEVDALPDISTIPRLEELFLRPPYHLIVSESGRSLVEVHCSHSPSLELLSDYLKKGCRVNYQDMRLPPVVDIKLHKSSFGLGSTYDLLTLSVPGRGSASHVTPVTVLAFVEGVLGYKNVAVEASTWTFRKDVEFRRTR
ncbi:hypothetical protein GGS23DRAFT_254687 [Durotheca rogersii]|uniref:uncharacterized protein n=1 Tax=Durotheca rogersii TaxID=419775 RepID=UPI00221E8B55|nr:uncharacterized protein GGS23DRAFT_254687 [Durotheca rogersii]KAI5859930.1 hypothetical protein GGS23DRAFT_254687 [Durotheca rogersii]